MNGENIVAATSADDAADATAALNQRRAERVEHRRLQRTTKMSQRAAGELRLLADAWAHNHAAFVAIDVEWHETRRKIAADGHRAVLEVGWTCYCPSRTAEYLLSAPSGVTKLDDLLPHMELPWYSSQVSDALHNVCAGSGAPAATVDARWTVARHMVVSSTVALRNGVHVADNKVNFLFGRSNIASIDEIASALRQDLERLTKGGLAVYLVGHDPTQDLRILEDMGVALRIYPTLDTGLLYSAVFGDNESRSLKFVASACEIAPRCLHNAGNDAYYTMRVTLKLANKLTASSLPSPTAEKTLQACGMVMDPGALSMDFVAQHSDLD